MGKINNNNAAEKPPLEHASNSTHNFAMLLCDSAQLFNRKIEINYSTVVKGLFQGLNGGARSLLEGTSSLPVRDKASEMPTVLHN